MRMVKSAVAVDRVVESRHGLALAAIGTLLVALVVLGAAGTCRAEHSYPRLANIYFPSLEQADLEALSRWDLLVLAKRAEDREQEELAELRELNPEIELLAHMAVGYSRGYTSPPINADLTAAEREELQKRVVKLHRHWPKDRDYLAPPTVGKLVDLDPALIMTPPEGMEAGYVPIATRQTARKDD